MDRAGLAAWLTLRLNTLLAAAGIASTDTEDGLAPVLDDLEVRLAGTPDLQVAWHQPLARYVALEWIVDRLGSKMDVTTGGDSFRLNQQFANAKALRDDARAAVAWIIDGSGSVQGISSGPVTIDLNFLTGGGSW